MRIAAGQLLVVAAAFLLAGSEAQAGCLDAPDHFEPADAVLGSYDNTVSWIPPLIVNEGQIKEALGMFETALNEAGRQA